MGFELRDGAGMNDSSQIIYNVKKTATRIIQGYLKLWVEERCPDNESWTKQVESICDEARSSPNRCVNSQPPPAAASPRPT